MVNFPATPPKEVGYVVDRINSHSKLPTGERYTVRWYGFVLEDYTEGGASPGDESVKRLECLSTKLNPVAELLPETTLN